MNLKERFEQQQLDNAYELVDGVAMHAENGARFQIPPEVLKEHVGAEQFVELRVDSAPHDRWNPVCDVRSCSTCIASYMRSMVATCTPPPT